MVEQDNSLLHDLLTGNMKIIQLIIFMAKMAKQLVGQLLVITLLLLQLLLTEEA